MFPTPNPSEPNHPTEEDARLKTFLYNILEAGDKVIQSLARQADLQAQPTQEGQPSHPIVDVAGQFEAAARAMRRTILLIRNLSQPRNNPATQRTEARKRIIREVEDVIQRSDLDHEPLKSEFRERLDAPDLEDEIGNRPLAAIIMDIRRDLGLEGHPAFPPYQRRTPRDLMALHATAAAPKAPGPYDPAPHGPDPGAPKPKNPRKPPDPAQAFRELGELAKRLS